MRSLFNLWRLIKEASIQTKIFWIAALGMGILTAVMCFYPYLWFDLHRSARQITKTEVKR